MDRLLASPQYGERWGRVWLDVARYGEDDYRSLNPNPRGYHPYPNAFMYRDWVIQAFNDDMPYDQFVKAQIAGDLMDEKTRYKTLPATGFLGLGPWYFDNGAVEVTRADERHDRVDVVTRGFLGMTVACARCHDHKYDPIPQTDYYSLAGVFLNTDYDEYPLVPEDGRDEVQDARGRVEQKQQDAAGNAEEPQHPVVGNAGAEDGELPAGRVGSDRPQKKRNGERGGGSQAGLRTARPLDQVHGQADRQVQDQGSLAGDDEEGRQRPAGEEARREFQDEVIA